MRATASTILLLLIAPYVATAEDTPAARQYKALLDEYDQQGGARVFAKRFLAMAMENANDPAAVDALLWVVKTIRGKSATTQALELLQKHHIRSEKLGPACKIIAASRSIAAEKLLRATLENNPDRHVQAQACFYLASLLDRKASISEQLKAQPEIAPRILQYYGQEYGAHLSSLDPVDSTKRREQVYGRLLRSFPDVEVQDSTMGRIAEKALFAIRHLSVGRLAPEITGEDILGKEFKLSDYHGRVVMLSFWGHW